MVNKEEELFKFVDNFKKEFNTKFGFSPHVLFANNPTQNIISRLPIETVVEASEKCLQEALKEKNKTGYTMLSGPKCRETVDYKHAMYKILYDIGYNIFMIANYFNAKSSNISQSITKVDNFINIKDPLFMNILNKIENELKKQTSQSSDNVQQNC